MIKILKELISIDYPNEYQNNKLIVFRGVGSHGIKNIRPSETGVHGSGIYFYNNPYEARTYAGRGGGILVGLIDELNIKQIGTVIVLQDLKKYKQIGVIPTEKTLDRKDIEIELNKIIRR